MFAISAPVLGQTPMRGNGFKNGFESRVRTGSALGMDPVPVAV